MVCLNSVMYIIIVIFCVGMRGVVMVAGYGVLTKLVELWYFTVVRLSSVRHRLNVSDISTGMELMALNVLFFTSHIGRTMKL